MYVIDSPLYYRKVQTEIESKKLFKALNHVTSWSMSCDLIKFWTNLYDIFKKIEASRFNLLQEARAFHKNRNFAADSDQKS